MGNTFGIVVSVFRRCKPAALQPCSPAAEFSVILFSSKSKSADPVEEVSSDSALWSCSCVTVLGLALQTRCSGC